MYPQARNNDLVIQDINDEVFIYDLKTDKVYSLNSTSAYVWSNLDGKTSVSELTKKMKSKFAHLVNKEMIWLAIDGLSGAGLLEKENLPKPMSKVKRREVIKKIGLATMTGLPIISSLIAPTALQAASGPSGTAACSNCTGVGGQGTCGPGLTCKTALPPGPAICTAVSGMNVSQVGYMFGLAYGGIYGNITNSAQCASYTSRYCCNGTGVFVAPQSCTCT